MATGLLHLHNLLRWIILILLFVAIYQAFTKNKGVQKISLFLLISAHITLLLGLYQYFMGNMGIALFKANGSEVMKNPSLRFWAVEHITGMIIAIVLITIARGKAKTENYNALKWLYLVALIIILAVVPWPFRAGIGRPWFPGMG
jgi:glucan phosphoethanolaminetransferase (alkaline phosphatase superfamily)